MDSLNIFWAREDAPTYTDISKALENGSREKAIELLQSIGSPDAIYEEREGISLLHAAARYGNARMIRFLLENGASVDVAVYGQHGASTPLHWAVNRAHLACVLLLLDAGADMNAEGEMEGTPLLHVFGYHADSDEDMLEKRLSVIRVLVDRGADINVFNANLGGSVLCQATRAYGHDIVRFCISRGAIHLDEALAEARSVPTANLLIEAGAKVTVHKWNAIVGASLRGNLPVVKRLVEVASAEAIAASSGALHEAAVSGAFGVLKFLLSERVGLNVDSRSQRDSTPLHAMMGQNSVEISVLNLLLESGADINARTANGDTALHIAAHSCLPEAVDILLKAHPDLNAVNMQGETPLLKHVSSLNRPCHNTFNRDSKGLKPRLQVITAMLDAGADARIRDRQGRTALHRGATCATSCDELIPHKIDNIIALLELLLLYGADATAEDENGQIPADVIPVELHSPYLLEVRSLLLDVAESGRQSLVMRFLT